MTYKFKKGTNGDFKILEEVKDRPEEFKKIFVYDGYLDADYYQVHRYEGFIKAKSLEEAKKRITNLGSNLY